MSHGLYGPRENSLAALADLLVQHRKLESCMPLAAALRDAVIAAA